MTQSRAHRSRSKRGGNCESTHHGILITTALCNITETPVGNGRSTYASNLTELDKDEDEDEFTKKQIMEKAMRMVQTQLDGSVAKLADVKSRADDIAGELIGSYARKIEAGVYRGSILAFVWRNANLSSVVPSAAV